MEYPKDWHFPMKCPVCAAVDGTPLRVSTEAALLTVEVRCATCQNEWSISAPAPAMFVNSDRPVFRQKVDRRNSHKGGVVKA